MSPLYHESIPTTSGVYRIRCTVTNRVYIGSARNLRKRCKEHFNDLERNKHYNPKLQRAFNKYGPDTFVFEIIEIILIPELCTAREQWWLDKTQAVKKGFNICPNAQSPGAGRKHTLEACKKIAAWHLGRPSPHKGGYKASPETIERLRISHLGNTSSLGIKRTPEQCARNGIVKSKTFIITAPDGTECTILGLKGFCQEHGLNVSGLARVARGQQSDYKGWKARYPAEESKQASESYAMHDSSNKPRLTESDVRAIRAAPGGKGKINALAKQYGVSEVTIYCIRAGKTWKHVS